MQKKMVSLIPIREFQVGIPYLKNNNNKTQFLLVTDEDPQNQSGHNANR